MNGTVNLEDILISAPYGSENEYESVTTFEDGDPYIKWLSIDFALENEVGFADVFVYGEKEKADHAARLFGALILGTQALEDGRNFIKLCDDCDGDLYEMAEELESEDLLEDLDGIGRNVLYIDTLELSSELIDASNLRQFFDLIPRYVFQYTNIMPQIICYQISSIEGYYEKAALETRFDPRSVNETSPQLFIENGYTASESGILLYKIVGEDIDVGDTDDEGPELDEDDPEIEHKPDLGEPDPLTGEKAQELHAEYRSTQEKAFTLSNRSLLEDPIAVGFYSRTVLTPRTTPRELVSYVEAALCAHDLGVRMDYALKMYVSDSNTDIPPIHTLFQKMYFAGKTHMESTIERMHPKDVPNAGETFADAALVRAANSYYVAALLYREGHMIEAHAMSRLMLEQIAWAFAACKVENYHAAEKISPSKAIGIMKKKFDAIKGMYGALSKYVHLPLKGHYEFIDLSQGESAVMQQFGAHSYAQGTILAHLADYWSAVYEYTQSRHFDELENWTKTSSELELNPNRPFLSTIQPILEELMKTYEADYPSYGEFLRSHWAVDDASVEEPDDMGTKPVSDNK